MMRVPCSAFAMDLITDSETGTAPPRSSAQKAIVDFSKLNMKFSVLSSNVLKIYYNFKLYLAIVVPFRKAVNFVQSLPNYSSTGLNTLGKNAHFFVHIRLSFSGSYKKWDINREE